MKPSLQTQKQDALQKIADVVRFRHLSLNTERTYCYHVGLYIDWLFRHGRDLPDSRSRMEAYLTAMANRGCAASTQNQAFNALLFFYEQVRREKIENVNALRAKRPAHIRTSLPQDMTIKLVTTTPNVAGYPTSLVTRMLYGMGLRVSEPLNLRIKDVLVSESRLVIRGAKGGKDRVVNVPCSLMREIEAQMKRARVLFERDQLSRLPVEVPTLLARKYKNAPYSWQWYFLFPAHRPCVHPRTKEMVRYRMHEANVQRAVKIAAKALDIDSLATPHVLRHCYATHVLDEGAIITDVQTVLGHSDVRTTSGYVHPKADRVKSPMEGIA